MSAAYVLKKTGEAVATLFIVVTLTFFLLRLLPGGPFDQETALEPRVKAHLQAHYGLDRPVVAQYFTYLGGLFRGDLGVSYKNWDQDVSEVIRDTLPVTLKLGLMSLFLSFIVGVPLGLWTASVHRTQWDRAGLFVTVSGISLPSFLSGPLLILLFSFKLDLLPPALWESPKYYILPVITLAIRPLCLVARLVRASALDVIHSDYVRTARAKGVGESRLLLKHVLRNSLIPVMSLAGSLVANILTGSLVVEMIFAVPGIARHFIQSVDSRDYPLILSLTLLYAVILVIGNLVMDLLATAVDPRIKGSR